MWKASSLTAALVALFAPKMAGGACSRASISIDTSALNSISGCFNETIYAGLYETKVWTIDGSDIVAPAGTKAIVADLQNSSDAEPVWVIGTVVSLAQNTWSDGYSAGLEVVDVVCTGTSAFWETSDPTEEIQWACDADGDGVVSVAEAGDFKTIACGCPDEAGNIATPSPTAGVVGVTVAPVAAVTRVPTPALVTPTTAPIPEPALATPTTAPIPGEPALTSDATNQVTPAPSIVGALAPTAVECNITLSSTALQDVSGCFVGRASSNSRGSWVQLDESASIDWQVTEGGTWGWVVNLIGSGAPDEEKCISSESVEDPTEITTTSWACDLTGNGAYSPAEGFDFDGLECSGACEDITAVEAVDGGSSSDGSIDRTTAIVVGSVVSGVGLAVLIVIGAVFMRRKGTKVKRLESAEDGAPTDPNAAPVPAFEPWGTRPPPKFYG
ncbi:unnamed protein product [Pylaiella littoralis]